jgi:chromosome segregation ATPase
LCELLIQKGADPLLRDDFGRLAVDYIASNLSLKEYMENQIRVRDLEQGIKQKTVSGIGSPEHFSNLTFNPIRHEDERPSNKKKAANESEVNYSCLMDEISMSEVHYPNCDGGKSKLYCKLIPFSSQYIFQERERGQDSNSISSFEIQEILAEIEDTKDDSEIEQNIAHPSSPSYKNVSNFLPSSLRRESSRSTNEESAENELMRHTGQGENRNTQVDLKPSESALSENPGHFPKHGHMHQNSQLPSNDMGHKDSFATGRTTPVNELGTLGNLSLKVQGAKSSMSKKDRRVSFSENLGVNLDENMSELDEAKKSCEELERHNNNIMIEHQKDNSKVLLGALQDPRSSALSESWNSDIGYTSMDDTFEVEDDLEDFIPPPPPPGKPPSSAKGDANTELPSSNSPKRGPIALPSIISARTSSILSFAEKGAPSNLIEPHAKHKKPILMVSTTSNDRKVFDEGVIVTSSPKKELIPSLHESTSSIDFLQSKLKDLESPIKSSFFKLRYEYEETYAQLSSEKAKNRRLQEEIDRISMKLQAKTELAVEIDLKVQKLQKELEDQEYSHKGKLKGLETLIENDLATKRRMENDLKTIKDEYRDEVAALRDALKINHELLESKTNQLQKLNSKQEIKLPGIVSNPTTQLESKLDPMLESATSKLDYLVKENSVMQVRINSLIEEQIQKCEAYDSQVLHLTTELLTVQTQNKALLSQVSALESLQGNSKSRVEYFEAELIQLQESKEDLVKQNNVLKMEIEKQKVDYDFIKEELKSRENRKVDSNRLEKDLARLRESYEALESSYDKLQAAHSRLLLDKNEERERASEDEADTKLKNDLKNISDQLIKITAEKDLMKVELATRSEKINEFQTSDYKLKSEVATLKCDYQRIIEETHNLNQKSQESAQYAKALLKQLEDKAFEIDRIQLELHSAQQENSRLKKKAEEFELDQKQSEEKERQDMQTIKNYLKQVDEKNIQVDRIKFELLTAHEENLRMKKKLEDSELALKSTNEECESLERKVRVLTSEVKSLQEIARENEAIAQEINELREDHRQIGCKLKKKDQELSEIRTSLAASETQRDHFQEQALTLKSDMVLKSNEIEELNSQIRSLETSSKQSRCTNEKTLFSMEELNRELQRKVKTLEEDSKSSEAEFQTLSAKLAIVSKENEILREELDSHRSKLTTTTSSLKCIQESFGSESKRIKSLESEQYNLKSALDKKTQDCLRLEGKLKDVEGMLIDANKRAAELQADLERLRIEWDLERAKSVATLSNERHETIASVMNHLSALQQEKERVASLESKMSILHIKFSGLEETLAEAEARENELKRKIQHIRDTSEEAESERIKSNRKIFSRISELEEENLALRKALNAAKAHLEMTSKIVREQENQAEKKTIHAPNNISQVANLDKTPLGTVHSPARKAEESHAAYQAPAVTDKNALAQNQAREKVAYLEEKLRLLQNIPKEYIPQFRSHIGGYARAQNPYDGHQDGALLNTLSPKRSFTRMHKNIDRKISKLQEDNVRLESKIHSMVSRTQKASGLEHC